MSRAPSLALLLVLAACSGDDGELTQDDSHTDGHTHEPTDPGHVEVREAATDGGSWDVGWAPEPDPIPLNEPFDVTVEVWEGSTSTLAAGVSLVFDAYMPSHGHGMSVVPTTIDNGDGTFLVQGMQFQMEGPWEITAEITLDDVTEMATFEVECCE